MSWEITVAYIKICHQRSLVSINLVLQGFRRHVLSVIRGLLALETDGYRGPLQTSTLMWAWYLRETYGLQGPTNRLSSRISVSPPF